jgi:hypothetical protein
MSLLLNQQEYDERNIFLERLELLVKSEHEEVFRIIKRNEDNWSENSNGIIFDVATLKKDTFEKLKNFMEFCMKNRKEQEERQKEMEALRSESEIINST